MGEGGKKEERKSEFFCALFFELGSPKKGKREKKKLKRETHVEVKVAGLVAVLGRDLDGGAGAGGVFGVVVVVEEEREEEKNKGEGETKIKKRLKSEREGEGRDNAFVRRIGKKDTAPSLAGAPLGAMPTTPNGKARRAVTKGVRGQGRARGRATGVGVESRNWKSQGRMPPSCFSLAPLLFSLALLLSCSCFELFLDHDFVPPLTPRALAPRSAHLRLQLTARARHGAGAATPRGARPGRRTWTRRGSA